MASSGPAPVAIYCGHMFNAGSAEEPALAGRIAVELERLGIGTAFGPLACGADILIAEALLARGAELNVVLPFAEDDFVEGSVLCGGEAWLPRYHACRAAAAAVHFATPGDYVGDDNQFAYNTRFAMGLAALRADAIGAEAVQIAVVSDKVASFSLTGLAGTVADIAIWQGLGRDTITISAGPVPRDLVFPRRDLIEPGLRREIRSILFADYKGFSRLGEGTLPLFMKEVMGRIGEVLDAFGDHVEFRNSWGDALYAVIDEPRVAARIAIALQERLHDLPDALVPAGAIAGMRIGVHYGPIWVATDPITGGSLWFGGEVNRTARIEPVTPVGGVYCTETFAAALLVEGCNDCSFERVGRVQLAKNFGEVELYRLGGV
jgi:class 3 adenylate cyclase